MPGTGSAYLNDGSGTRQPGAVHEGQHLLRERRRREHEAVQLDRGERQDRGLRQLTAPVPELVEGAGHPEGDEDVDVALPSVAEREEQLEVAARHPQQGPAASPQLALDPVGLEDQVRRGLGVAQVADVGVGVVGDHRAVAHGAEQGAVVEVRRPGRSPRRGRAARAACRPGSRRARRRRWRRRRGTGGPPCPRRGAAPAGPRCRSGPRRSRGSRPRRPARVRPTGRRPARGPARPGTDATPAATRRAPRRGGRARRGPG